MFSTTINTRDDKKRILVLTVIKFIQAKFHTINILLYAKDKNNLCTDKSQFRAL